MIVNGCWSKGGWTDDVGIALKRGYCSADGRSGSGSKRPRQGSKKFSGKHH